MPLLPVLTLFLAAALAHGVQLPLEVTAWDAAPVMKTASVQLPSGGNSAAALYLRIHNLRFGGQVSVRLNGGDWVHLYNHTVTIDANELSQGGIGGINRTLALTIPLTPGQALAGQANAVSIRLNGTNGIVSAIRMIDLDFLDATGTRLLPPEEITQEDPSAWAPPSSSPADIALGASLWATANLYVDPIRATPMRGKCASCHFADGSDLKYFNYSNETIITRSRFHGLTEQEGEQIASYLRSSMKPSPGRPWNPPFQPGPGLDPLPTDSALLKQQKARAWMAGAGLQWVVKTQSEMLPHVFPEGTSPAQIAKVIDHEGNFSVREIPITIQLPDWNAWLPEHAPEDLWPTSNYYNVPWALYTTFRNALANPGVATLTAQGNLIATFDNFNRNLNNWFGDFRLLDQDLANQSAVALARSPGLSYEDASRNLVHWMALKLIEGVRDFDLEDKADAASAMQARGHTKFAPDVLLIPGSMRLATVFAHAPHITSVNWSHFENQPPWLGKMESNQWYHLQLCLNSGSRMAVSMNVPLDWDYQLGHTEEAGERAGIPYGFQRFITHLKMYQSRDNGAGVRITGFSQRTLSPWRLYSVQALDRSLFKGALDAVQADLWRRTYEEFLHEYLDVMESMDLNDPVLVPRTYNRHELEPPDYVPVPWPGGGGNYFVHPDEVYADLMFRLLPLLPKEGIDELLLEDLRTWSRRAWPLGDWDSLFTRTALYAENFEDHASDFVFPNSELIVTAIKNASYVNTYAIGPRNGGGAYVGQRGLTANAVRMGINDTINAPVTGLTRLKFRARIAFKDDDGVDAGAVRFRMQARFNHSATTYDAETEMTLDPALYNKEFVSYESTLAVPNGATSINRLVLRWERVGGAGGGAVYIDNVQVLAVPEGTDVIAPPAPVFSSLTGFNNATALRLLWTHNTAAANGVVGYNVYRWIDGQPTASRVRINTGLVDNPYNRYEDFSAKAHLRYRYDVTAVDAAGNESAHSTSRAAQLADTQAPSVPSPVWGVNTTGALHFGWFSTTAWDIAGYDVYRRANGDAGFTQLTTITAPAEAIFYDDPTAIQGLTYEYYVRAYDLVGNLAAPSATFSLLAQTGVTHVSLWKRQFQGINGWDIVNSSLTSDVLDYDGDGLATLWEYVQGFNPAQSEANAGLFTTVSRVNVTGADYLEMAYTRPQTLPAGVVIKAEFSNDLQTWPLQAVIEGGPAGLGISASTGPVVNGRRSVRVRQTLPIGAGAYPFMRLSAEPSSP